jgi:uncharacterized membrane protein
MEDDITNLTIDSVLKQMGLIPGAPQKAPEPPTRGEKVLFALSCVAEFTAWVLLFISLIAVGITIVGLIGIVTMGSFLGIGLVNASLLAIAGGISGSAIMSAAISIRKLAQDARTAPALKKMMKAAGVGRF